MAKKFKDEKKTVKSKFDLLPSKEKEKAYLGLGNDWQNLMVQKSRAFLDIVRMGLSLEEQKLFDVYLARINSDNPDICTVVISKVELEKIFGVKHIRTELLEQNLMNLMKPIKTGNEKETHIFPLFINAKIRKEKSGINNIILTCHNDAKEYIFALKEKGKYVPYLILESISLMSSFSYAMFSYLEKNLFRRKWTEATETLKKILGATSEKYSEFKYFKRDVLNYTKKEIEEKTSMRFEFDFERNGRKIEKVIFTARYIKKLPDKQTAPEIIETTLCDTHQTRIDMDEVERLEYYGTEDLVILANACDFEFDKEQMQLIFDILTRIDIKKETETNMLIWGRHFYLREKYMTMCVKANEKASSAEPIKNRYGYLRAMLEKDTVIALTESAGK